MATIVCGNCGHRLSAHNDALSVAAGKRVCFVMACDCKGFSPDYTGKTKPR